MKSSLKIVAQPALLKDGTVNPNAGLVFTPSKNAAKAAEGWGTMRVDATQNQQLPSGLLIQKKVITFVPIQKVVFDFEGYAAGQTVPGIVQRILSFKANHNKDKQVVNPNTGEVSLMFGRPYYARTKWIVEPTKEDALNDFSQMHAQIAEELGSEEVLANAELNTATATA